MKLSLLRPKYGPYVGAACAVLIIFGLAYHHVTHTIPAFCLEQPTENLRAYCSKVSRAGSRPLRGHQLRIMAVGDSVTAGPLGQNAYRGDIVNMLADTNDLEMVGDVTWGTFEDPKYNRLEAMMGRDIYAIYEALEKSLPRWLPNVILIHAGTNEVLSQKEDKLAVLPHMLDKTLDLIAREIPWALTIVAEVIPCAFREAEVTGWNENVRNVVAKRVAETKQRVLTVDMYTDWPKNGHADVAHPNEMGYWTMANRFVAVMEVANGMGWITVD